MSASWRDHAKAVLKVVFDELPPEATLKDAQRAIKEAYPFGQRSMHPYKIWGDESRKWLEGRFPEYRRERQRAALQKELDRRTKAGKSTVAEVRQLAFLDGEPCN